MDSKKKQDKSLKKASEKLFKARQAGNKAGKAKSRPSVLRGNGRA